MTAPTTITFTEDELIGIVSAVDTSRVLIDVNRPALFTRVGIGNLVAIQGTISQEYLIGTIERVTRSTRDELLSSTESEDELFVDSKPFDTIRIMLVGTFRTLDGAKKNVFKRGAHTFPQIDRECHLLQGANLQVFMNLLSQGIDEGERLQLGHFVGDVSAVAIANGDKFFQRHASILGSTGSGKSWSVALILERASKLQFANIIVFDLHGEYSPLCGTDGYASRLRIAGPGDLEKTGDDTLFLPYWLLSREEMLSLVLDRGDNNAPNQTSRFTHHIKVLKERTIDTERKKDIKKTFTIDSPIPYSLGELMNCLTEDNTRKGVGSKGAEVKGEWEDKLTRMLSRIQAKLDDRRYGFMFTPPVDSLKYNWLEEQMLKLLGKGSNGKGIKIIDFSEVPADVLPIVTSLLARLVYNIQLWMQPDKRIPLTILCDEAHLYLPVKDDADAIEKQALSVFERIAKEGRKYGVSLLVVSQRPSDVSKTILSQCNNFLVLRLTNEADQQVVKRLVPDSMSGLTDILPLLDTGEALLLGDAVLLPSRIKLDKPSIEPDSATRDFWGEWQKATPDEDAIRNAVETLRRQTRAGK